MIDFHILTHPRQDRGSTRCDLLRTLESHPLIKTHLLTGIDGNIGKSRTLGFELGNAEYVSFADDDDSVLTDHISEILNILKSDVTVDAVVTNEQVLTDNRKFIAKKHYGPRHLEMFKPSQARFIHHLVILRRTSLNYYLPELSKHANFSEIITWHKMLIDGFKFIYFDEVCYKWVNHKNGARSIDIKVSDSTKKALSELLHY